MLKHFLGLLLLAAVLPLAAQSDDEVLFTVADKPVTVGEFRYIYGKTNGEEADFSRESVMEYLDLYQRFKLKVARAHDMGLDTVQSLQRELAGYRKQLADNYLMDRQVTDRLVEQLYDRKRRDVSFRHILLPARRNASPRDTMTVYQQALDIKKQLTVENFGELATQYSQDKYSKDKGGRIGFVNAPLPKGLHTVETAIYAAENGQIVGPVRSDAGYHLILKEDERPAYGEVEVAHLLARPTEDGDLTAARARLESALTELKTGSPFAQVAGRVSDDDNTKRDGGYLGFFGINRYDPAFEKAAFALERDGSLSPIVKTQAGLHIIKRISRRGVQPLEDIRPLLERQVKADGRFAAAKSRMIAKYKSEAGIQEDQRVLGQFASQLVDSTFFSYNWQPEATSGRDQALLTFTDGKVKTIDDFQKYLRKQTRRRIALGRNRTPYSVVKELFAEWTEQQVLAYAESRLEETFPEFAALMREYREGILLFEATKTEVWDKASADTVGLQRYYAKNKSNYRYGKRAEVTRYTVRNGALDNNAVLAAARAGGPDVVQATFGMDHLDAETDTYDLERLNELSADLPAEVGAVSPVINDIRKGHATFYKVERILPERQKELREARGYVIADYQDELERAWVDQLRKTYPVKVNKRVLNKLIGS